jgi:hypothetical protein
MIHYHQSLQAALGLADRGHLEAAE